MSEWRWPDVKPIRNQMSLAPEQRWLFKKPVKVVQPISNRILDKDYSKRLRNIVKMADLRQR